LAQAVSAGELVRIIHHCRDSNAILCVLRRVKGSCLPTWKTFSKGSLLHLIFRGDIVRNDFIETFLANTES